MWYPEIYKMKSYIRNVTSSTVFLIIVGTLGYNRRDSFRHLSKYGRFSNNDIVNFSSVSSNAEVTSVLIRSYIIKQIIINFVGPYALLYYLILR